MPEAKSYTYPSKSGVLRSVDRRAHVQARSDREKLVIFSGSKTKLSIPSWADFWSDMRRWMKLFTLDDFDLDSNWATWPIVRYS
jgi:hypothetical protein